MRETMPLAAFTGNAVLGAGGQGEFLRQMRAAVDAMPGGVLIARDPGAAPAGVAVPRAARTRVLQRALLSLPVLRGRDDLMTLMDDLDFDSGAARVVPRVDLLDGIMGQCDRTARVSQARGAAIVLTSLNTHIDTLAESLETERRRAGTGVRGFVHPAMQRRARREIARADWIRVNSTRAAESFVARGVPAGRVRVITPAVDLSHFTPQPVRVEQPFRVIAVGAIAAHKGPHDLLEAFVAARIPGAELEFLGGTGSRWARRLLERYQRDHAGIRARAVRMLDVSPASTYGSADVLVHASVEDGFGLVVSEALACGRPVIVTSTTGAAELVREGYTGFVVPPRDPGAIADRLALLASDRDLLARMSAAASASVAHLGYPAFVDAVRNFYREVTG